MKYNINLIKDYVLGNDIDYNIEALEDDYNFMIDVINYTNDKNMYNFCGNKVKNNYEFVKYIIIKFKTDKNFICNVVDNYLENEKDEINKLDIIILISKLTKNDKYNMLLDIEYYNNRLKFEIYKKQNEEDKFVNELGMGFLLIFDLYNSNERIMNFYAKKYIDEIFKENKNNLEFNIHEKFNNFNELKKYGITNYLLKLINENDVSLYNYLVCHINLLDDLKLEIQNIELNWNLYIEELERVKYNVIIDEVHDYFQEHEKEIKYEENEFLYRIAIELGIATQIKNIMDQNYPYDFDEYLENIKLLVDKKDMKFIELRHYENIKKIILKYLNLDIFEMKEETNKTKIIKLDFKNKIEDQED